MVGERWFALRDGEEKLNKCNPARDVTLSGSSLPSMEVLSQNIHPNLPLLKKVNDPVYAVWRNIQRGYTF